MPDRPAPAPALLAPPPGDALAAAQAKAGAPGGAGLPSAIAAGRGAEPPRSGPPSSAGVFEATCNLVVLAMARRNFLVNGVNHQIDHDRALRSLISVPRAWSDDMWT